MATPEGMQALQEQVLADARQAAEERLQAAEERAAAIRAEAEEARAAHTAGTAAQARRTSELERRRAVASAKAMARQRVLATREGLIARALAMARERLRTCLTPDERRYDIVRAIQDAARALGGGELTVQAGAPDRTLLGDALRTAGHELAERGMQAVLQAGPPADILGGAVVSKDEGRVIVDNSFDARMERLSWALRNDVWRLLGDEAGQLG
jgi:V/A-type H+/Na+-transporting ATPase subunit E